MPAPDKDAQQITAQAELTEPLSFCEPVQVDIARVHQRITELLTSPDNRIQQCLSYLTEHTGKMLRPCLVLLSGQCVGQVTDEHINLAAMVELVHQASLLHDDVIDSADIRRTGRTANALWGNTVAVLLGDFLLSKAFYLGSRVKTVAAGEILSAAAHQLCRGELMQNFQKGQWDITEQQYYEIIRAKTAALFQSSCQMGAVASNAPSERVDSLGQFALELGMAFQITDDLLDLLGTQLQAGKTLGTDLRQGKLTLPLIHWIQADTGQKHKRIEMLNHPDDAENLIRSIRESGSMDYALSQVHKHIDTAKKCIAALDPSPSKKALDDLADYVAQRLR